MATYNTNLAERVGSMVQVKNVKILKYDPTTNQVLESHPVLLLDVSGSMEERIGSSRKIDSLREAVKFCQGVKIFVFSNKIFRSQFEIPEPMGGTNMPGAFRYLRTVLNKNSKLLLVSDGLPQEPEESIREARYLPCPVDVLYIGRFGEEGEIFMQRLARETGGVQVTVDTMQVEMFPKKLKQGIVGLLYGK